MGIENGESSRPPLHGQAETACDHLCRSTALHRGTSPRDSTVHLARRRSHTSRHPTGTIAAGQHLSAKTAVLCRRQNHSRTYDLLDHVLIANTHSLKQPLPGFARCRPPWWQQRHRFSSIAPLISPVRCEVTLLMGYVYIRDSCKCCRSQGTSPEHRNADDRRASRRDARIQGIFLRLVAP